MNSLDGRWGVGVVAGGGWISSVEVNAVGLGRAGAEVVGVGGSFAGGEDGGDSDGDFGGDSDGDCVENDPVY